MCIKKLTILQEFCLETGTMMNQSKTKFMVINDTSCDKLPLVSGSLIGGACDSYTYLDLYLPRMGKPVEQSGSHPEQNPD